MLSPFTRRLMTQNIWNQHIRLPVPLLWVAAVRCPLVPIIPFLISLLAELYAQLSLLSERASLIPLSSASARGDGP